jgi:hypothetical protein
MKPVDPREIQKKRRIEEKQRKLEEQARKAKTMKIKIVAVFVLIILLFIGLGAFLAHRKEKAIQAAARQMELMEIKLVSGSGEFSRLGVFEAIPKGGVKLENPPHIKTASDSRVEVHFATGAKLIVFGSTDIQIQEFDYSASNNEARVVAKLSDGRVVYRCEKNNRFYFKTDRAEIREASSLGGSFEVNRDKTASLDIVISLDIALKVNKFGQQEIPLNPSHALRIDNTGKINTSFVSVSTRDW